MGRLFIDGERERKTSYYNWLSKYFMHNAMTMRRLYDASNRQIGYMGTPEEIERWIDEAWEKLPAVHKFNNTRVPNYYLLGCDESFYIVLHRNFLSQTADEFARLFNEVAGKTGLSQLEAQKFEKTDEMEFYAKNYPAVKSMFEWFQNSIFF